MEGFSGIVGISAGAKKNNLNLSNQNQTRKREEQKGISGPLTLGGQNLTSVNSSSNIREKFGKINQSTP